MLMKLRQLILIIGVLAIGVVSGLVYGWFINPVKYTDIRLENLEVDYQTDLVLMTAEIYTTDLDLAAAVQTLYVMRSGDINGLIADSLEYARQMNFSDKDIEKLNILKGAIDQYLIGVIERP